MARGFDTNAFAHAISRLACDPDLYDQIVMHLDSTAQRRSMKRFVEEIVNEVDRLVSPRAGEEAEC